MQQWRVIKTRQELSLRRWKNKRITGKRYKSKNKSYNWKSIKSKWIKWISLLMNYWNKPKVHTNKLLWINKNSNKLCKFFIIIKIKSKGNPDVIRPEYQEIPRTRCFVINWRGSWWYDEGNWIRNVKEEISWTQNCWCYYRR